jgi:uncharacterized protein with PQ loop repeat
MNELFSTYLGYAASGAVLISFLMKSMNVLRTVNTIGCLLFIAYGISIQSIPVVVTNAAIVCINLYYLLFKTANKQG